MSQELLDDDIINKINFLAIIDPTTAALKISGNNTGGKIVLAFDNSQVPEVLKAVLLEEQLIKVTLELA